MDSERDFPSKIDAFNSLRADGFKLSRAKFYKDTKAGRLVIENDGSVKGSSVKRYIIIAKLQRPAEASVAAAIRADRKVEQEIKYLKLRNERLEHENQALDGRYMDRATVEMEAASKWALVYSEICNLHKLKIPDWLDLAAKSGMAAAIDAARRDLDKKFNEIANIDEFIVEIGGGE